MSSAAVKMVSIKRRVRRVTGIPYFLILLHILLISTGCQSVDPVVKVGLVAPFEGRHRDVGYDALYSARLAVREINEAGGINGTRVALVALDDGGTPEFAEATARALVTDPRVVAVIGHWQPETTAAARDIYEENNLLFLAGGEEPYQVVDPALLPESFVTAYEEVTPFDEIPGPYAGPAYDAFQHLYDLFALAQEESRIINRESVHAAGKDQS